MARDPSSSIEIRVLSRRSSNVIHPVEVETPPLLASPSPGPVVYREIKHFKKWVPWLIPSFVVANIIMLGITMYVNNCPKNSASCIADFLGRFSFQPFKENPLLGPSSSTLQKMGALDVSRVVDRHQGWRLITCIWLHGGVFHLLANMLSLLVIGIRLEQEFGFVKIGLLYIISGFGGSLLSGLFIQQNISVGASGALFGLLGGMLSELIINWSIYANKLGAFLTLVVIIAINLAVGILPHVDNFAHIGGFLSGFLLGFVFLIRPHFGWVSEKYVPPEYSASPKPKFKTYQCILWVASVILLIVGKLKKKPHEKPNSPRDACDFVDLITAIRILLWGTYTFRQFSVAFRRRLRLTLGVVMLLRGVDANDNCSWCHYLSCVPTSKWSCKTEPAYCLSNQIGNQFNLTCSSNGKTSVYMLVDPTSSQIQSLCSQLCN